MIYLLIGYLEDNAVANESQRFSIAMNKYHGGVDLL